MDCQPHLRLVHHNEEYPDGSNCLCLTIDCDQCAVQFTDACDDCVISYLINHEPGTPVELDEEERRAIELLTDAGLVPPSRFRRRHGVA